MYDGGSPASDYSPPEPNIPPPVLHPWSPSDLATDLFASKVSELREESQQNVTTALALFDYVSSHAGDLNFRVRLLRSIYDQGNLHLLSLLQNFTILFENTAFSDRTDLENTFHENQSQRQAWLVQIIASTDWVIEYILYMSILISPTWLVIYMYEGYICIVYELIPISGMARYEKDSNLLKLFCILHILPLVLCQIPGSKSYEFSKILRFI